MEIIVKEFSIHSYLLKQSNERVDELLRKTREVGGVTHKF